MSYKRFFAMIIVSTVIMYLLMFLNTYSVDHLAFSQTRFWMALLMGAPMALIMIGFMWKMYGNGKANTGIAVSALGVFTLSLWLVRSQISVDDVSYMKAMIPHHSIAIMTSERAHIKDPEVRRLADGIIDAQVREIGEMERLIARLESAPIPSSAQRLLSYRARGAKPPEPQTDASVRIDTTAVPRSSY